MTSTDNLLAIGEDPAVFQLGTRSREADKYARDVRVRPLDDYDSRKFAMVSMCYCTEFRSPDETFNNRNLCSIVVVCPLGR